MKNVKNVLTVLVVGCVLAVVTVTQGAITDNMLSLYHFDGNMNNSFGGTGTLHGDATLQTLNQVGTGSLDTNAGTTGYASITDVDTIKGTQNWAISFWVNPQGNVNYGTVASFGGDKFRMSQHSDVSRWVFYNTGYGSRLDGWSFTKTNGQWDFICITADTSRIYVYQGSADASAPTQIRNLTLLNSTDALNSSADLILGGGVRSYVDELAIWGRTLSSADVAEVFNAGKAGLNLVPEPTTMALLGLGGLAFIRKHR